MSQVMLCLRQKVWVFLKTFKLIETYYSLLLDNIDEIVIGWML